MSLFVLRILYHIGIYKKCAVAEAISYYGMGLYFLLPKKYKLWGKVLTKKRLYDISQKRRRRLQSELTNHTTKINKLESWKKEIDDSIYRLNHFQNTDKDAGFVEY